jgi:tartrate-resistant acid phosphatase type 5
VNNHLCGQVDIYLCGHDHNRQWLDTTCGTEFVVSGAASKLTGMVGRGSPTLFEADDKAGFLWVEIREDRFVGEFYNIDGTLEYSREWTKVLPAG